MIYSQNKQSYCLFHSKRQYGKSIFHFVLSKAKKYDNLAAGFTFGKNNEPNESNSIQ